MKEQADKDNRLTQIMKLLIQYSQMNFSAQGKLSGKGDELDAIIAGLNTMAQEVGELVTTYKEKDKRIIHLMEVLLHFTVMDFDYKAPISEKGDEIDAIAAGLNTLSEEMEALLAAEKEQMSEIQHYVTQLEFANKELDSFTYSVSHDLRTPLRAINSFTNILFTEYKDKIDKEGLRMMKIVMDEAKRMGNLIDDLLALSRLGKIEIKKNPIDMNQLVIAAFNELKEINGKIKLDIKNLLPVYGDESLLRQVLINLLSNAIKFSNPKPDPHIEVGSFAMGNENIYFVKDNGVGFNMDYSDQLFNTFQRLHRQDEFEGTGIGLTIVKRIIEHHGGRVWAEAKEQEGAIFYFSLPNKKLVAKNG